MNTEHVREEPDANGCICPQDFTRPDCPSCYPSPTTVIKVEIVSRRIIDVNVALPMKEAWAQREKLAASHIPYGWAVERYFAEGIK